MSPLDPAGVPPLPGHAPEISVVLAVAKPVQVAIVPLESPVRLGTPLNVKLPDSVPERAPPLIVGDVRVRPAIVDTVAPDDISVEPRVGAV